MQQEKFYSFIENPDLLNAESLLEMRALTEKYPYFQAAMILHLKNLKDTGNPEYETALKKTAILVPDRKKLYRILHPEKDANRSNIFFDHSVEIKVHDHQNASKTPTEDLIEKFLSKSPGPIKIEKQDQERLREETEKTILTKSAAENDEMITETLANIYVEQKKYDKALSAFKKLSLKYPEKNIYFATRIEEIERRLNI